MNQIPQAIQLQPNDTPFFYQDIKFLENVLIQFIQSEMHKYGFKDAVIALSGVWIRQ